MLTNLNTCVIIISVVRHETKCRARYGSIAQLGEHLPYKQRVIGSSPIVPTTSVDSTGGCNNTREYGPVVQLVRTLACHARGQGFESPSGRHVHASVAQLVEQRTENPRVVGSIPTGGTIPRSSHPTKWYMRI